MSLTIQTEPVPIYPDADGVLRVGESRVPLEIVIEAFQDGAEPRDIVKAYDTLDLADVHAVISYYLRHQREVDDYILKRDEEARELESQILAAQPPEKDLRAELLARRDKMRSDNASPGR